MASTFSPNLSIELIGTGDQAGTWGTTTNSNLGTLIEQAISGYVTQAVATGTDTTITIPNGATGVARNMYIELTGTGGTNTNLIVPANKKLYFIFNNSTGAVTVKVSGQTGVSVPTGKKMVLVSNGTDIVNGLNYIADFGTNSFSVTNLTASSGTITNLIATSGSITNLVSSDASATVLRAGSATLTHLSATSASITNLTLTSLVISNLSIASANITTLTGSTQTLSGNLTLSGGTANGVAFLNASKVVTSGTDLVFNATGLGIGTASPAAGTGSTKSLEASGPILTGGAINANQTSKGVFQFLSNETTIRSYGDTAGTGQIVFKVGGGGGTADTEAARFNASGNLGIGTATMKVTGVSGSGSGLTIAGGVPTLGLQSGAGASDYFNLSQINANTYIWNIANGFMAFGTNNTERMRLDSSGNLGIGTASPTQKLTVNGNAAVGGQQYFWFRDDDGFSSSVTRRAWAIGANVDVFGALSFKVSTAANGNPTTGTTVALLDSSGNLGIGVTPSAWGTSGTILKALQIGAAGSVAAGTVDPSIHTSQNAYFDGTNWNRIDTGSAAGNYYISGNTHNWRIAASGANPISFTQAMTLDASGNLGVGTTSPAQKLHIAGGTSVALRISATGNAASGLQMGFAGSAVDTFLSNTEAGNLIFGTSNTERARLTSGGNLLVGCTAVPSTSVEGFCATGTSSGNLSSSGASTSAYNHWLFLNGNGTVGSISTSGSATTYSTSSDRRLKDNIAPADNAGSVIDAIEVVKHDWKAGGHTRYGMIAQDLHMVAPEAVSVGDANDVEDFKNPWGVDYSKLVPMLVKELQSLRKRVAELESK